MNRRALLIVCSAVGLAVLALLIVRLLPERETASQARVAAPVTMARVAPTLHAAEPAPEMTDISLPTARQLTPEEARAAAIEKIERTKQIYLETMVYPPWSRPFDGSTRHLLKWNDPWPAGQPFAADKDRREIRVDVTLDRLYAGPGEALHANLKVAYVDDGTPVDPEEMTAQVEIHDEKRGFHPVHEVSFTRVAPGQYKATFVPSQIPQLAAAPREAHLKAFVRIGEFPKALIQQFRYAARESFVVHGVASDRVADGSLEVLLDVDVKHVAPTLIQAVLFDVATNTPIAVVDDYFRPQRTGRQTAPLRFFGKILYEKGLDGPYRLKAVHGNVRVPNADPPEAFWSRADEPALVTQPYRATQFSRHDWSSPEKDEKLRSYQALLRDIEAGR